MGNLRSVEKGFEKVGFPAEVFREAGMMAEFDAIVLPGVGAFGDAMKSLQQSGAGILLLKHIEEGKPFLGICLGMQVLFDQSEEHGLFKGLGVISGCVKKLPKSEKVPHMGWNIVTFKKKSEIFEGIPDNSRFYFVHSYFCVPEDDSFVLGKTPHGIEFASAVGKNKVFGVQFHPEKSSILGLKVLRNFGRIVSSA